MKFIIGFLDGWRQLIAAMERTLVSNVAATVPWLAPIAPAYMAWHNSVNLLSWPIWVAWMVAAAIEGLGMSVVSTAFELWDWNDTKKDKDQNAPVLIAVAAVIFYLSVVIIVNVLLELGWPVWIAKALLSLLSVPAVVTLALRSQHARRMDVKHAEDEIRREERKEEREFKRQMKLMEARGELPKVSAKVSETSANQPATFGKWQRWPAVPDETKREIARVIAENRAVNSSNYKKLSADYLVHEFGLDERGAYNWIGYAERDFPSVDLSPSPQPSPEGRGSASSPTG